MTDLYLIEVLYFLKKITKTPIDSKVQVDTTKILGNITMHTTLDNTEKASK